MEAMVTQVLELYAKQISFLLITLIVLTIIVSVITEVTKNLGFLAALPTDLQVIILSQVLCILAYTAYSSHLALAITWYYLIATIILAFFVAFLAMYGWEKLIGIAGRFTKIKDFR